MGLYPAEAGRVRENQGKPGIIDTTRKGAGVRKSIYHLHGASKLVNYLLGKLFA